MPTTNYGRATSLDVTAGDGVVAMMSRASVDAVRGARLGARLGALAMRARATPGAIKHARSARAVATRERFDAVAMRDEE